MLVLPLDLVDEVQLDARCWQARHHTLVRGLVIVELRLRVIALIIDNHINDAVVAETTGQRSIHNLRVARLADVYFASDVARIEQTRVDVAQLVVSMKRTHPVVHLLSVLIPCRCVGAGWVQAVKMPVLATEVAWDDHAGAT